MLGSGKAPIVRENMEDRGMKNISSSSSESKGMKGWDRNCTLLIGFSVKLLMYYKSVLTNSVGESIVSEYASVKWKAVNASSNMF